MNNLTGFGGGSVLPSLAATKQSLSPWRLSKGFFTSKYSGLFVVILLLPCLIVCFIHTLASCYFGFSFESPVFFHNCTMYLYTDMNTLRDIRVRYHKKVLIFFFRFRNLPPEADLFSLVFSAFSPRHSTIQSGIFLSTRG